MADHREIAWGNEITHRDEESTLRQRSLLISVTDVLQRPITGLAKGNFEILEDGVSQEVTRASEVDIPFSVVFVVSRVSGRSNRGRLQQTFPKMLAPIDAKDEAWFIDANQPTSRARPLETREEFSFTNNRSGSHLSESLVLAAQLLEHSRNESRLIVVISNGGNSDEHYASSELAECFKTAKVQFVVKYLVDADRDFDNKLKLDGLLERAADVVELREASPTHLQVKLSRINALIRNQYVLEYNRVRQTADRQTAIINVKINLPKGLPSETHYFGHRPSWHD